MKYQALFFTECNGSIGFGRDMGCYTVSSRLREAGYKTKVIDFFSHFNFDRFKAAIDNFASDETLFLGFSSTHFSKLMPNDWETHWSKDSRTRKNDMWNVYFPFDTNEMQEWITYAKNKFPKLKIIVGGQKVAQKQSLQKLYPFVDHWVGGMADVSIIHIAESLTNNKSLPNKIKSELDFGSMTEHAFANNRILWDDSDLLFPGEAIPIEIARGCPFNCSFCDFRKKETNTWILNESVLRDTLIENYEKFGISHYMATDFQVNENMKKMEMIHRVFTNLPFKITWSGFGRLDILNNKSEMIDMIYESGCRSIQWGIETVTDAVGPLVGKVTKRDVIEGALDACKSKWNNDVIMGSGFVLGLPGENMQSSIELIKWTETQTWLDGWEIVPLFIGTYNPSKEYTIDFSKIQQQPAKYGYEVSMELSESGVYIEEWKNGDMSRSKMIQLIEQTQNSESWKRRLMTSYLGYSRCSNLGFTHDELRSANKYNQQWIIEHAVRYRSLANKYLARNNIL
jgi:hypothetical protein